MITPFSIQVAMIRLLFPVILIVGCAQAQVAMPATSATMSDDAGRQQTTAATDVPLPGGPRAKVGLVRGVMKRLDPIHDQLLIHTFLSLIHI